MSTSPRIRRAIVGQLVMPITNMMMKILCGKNATIVMIKKRVGIVSMISIGYMLDPVNKENVTRIMATNLRLSNTSEADEAYQAVFNVYERLPLPTVEGMKRLYGLLLTINPKLPDVKVETLIDDSFIHRLEASGFVQSVAKKR